jgi:hypothetical protein
MVVLQNRTDISDNLRIGRNGVATRSAQQLSSSLDSMLGCPFYRSGYIERPAEPKNGQENEK